MGFPYSSVGKESAFNAGDLGSIPGLGRSPGEGNGKPLQYSCLENPMGREAWQATVHGVTRVGHDLVTKPPPPLLYMHAKWLESCTTFCDPVDCSPLGSSVHGIFQATILECVAISYSMGSSGPRDKTHISMSPALAGGFFTTSANWEAHHYAGI